MASSCSPKITPSESSVRETDFTKIDAMIRAKDFAGPEAALLDILRKQPDNASALYRLGAIMYEQKIFSEADSLISKSAQLTNYEDEEILFAAIIAANANDDYENVLNNGPKYFSLKNSKPSKVEKVELMLANNQRLKTFVENPSDAKPRLLGENINTAALEYLPSISLEGNNLSFVRRTGQKEVIYTAQGQGYDWDTLTPFEIWNEISSVGAYSVSPDKTRAVVTICGSAQGQGSCDLYLSKKRNNSWTEPMNLGNVINSRNWDSQPCFSANGSTLFFASDRAGGFGGRDIYYVTVHNGKWGEPVNMGPKINSPGNEESPFIHPDGSTFYFRSDYWPGMGSFDVFISRLSSDLQALQEPVNLGHPINSTSDDGAFTISPDGKMAYLTTDRFSKKSGGRPHLDIVGFELPATFRPVPTTWIALEINDRISGEAIPATYQLTDLSTGTILVEGIFLEWESVSLPVKTGTSLGLFVKHDSYVPFSMHISSEQSNEVDFPHVVKVELERLESDNSFILQNVFFESNSAILLEESSPELTKLSAFMKENKNMHLEIIGHTDNIGTESDNLELSLLRAKAVVAFIVSQGIDSSRLSFKGKGENEPLESNDSEAGRSKNRRTEFRIVKQ